MRFAICECLDCHLEFMIKLDNCIPACDLRCCVCLSNEIKIKWIDRYNGGE